MDEPVRFRPTTAPAGIGEPTTIRFETAEEAARRDAEFRAFMQPGQEVPLLWEDGVTTLEVAAVHPDGMIEIRSKR